MTTRSSTETLMSALGECETAQNAMIILDHGDEGISWHSNSSRLSANLAMVEFVRVCLHDNICDTREADK